MPESISFASVLWQYSAGKGSWFFVTLPREDTEFIKWIENKRVVGFGFIPVEVTVGGSTWNTTLFPSKVYGYILAVNAKVRKTENIHEGDTVHLSIKLI